MLACPARRTRSAEAVTLLQDTDPLVQHYRAFFALLDWSQVPARDPLRPWPGTPPHPAVAYVKAQLVQRTVANYNTLIYIVINVRALAPQDYVDADPHGTVSSSAARRACAPPAERPVPLLRTDVGRGGAPR